MRGLAAQHLLPGPGHDIELLPGQVHREGRGGRITNRQALAIPLDPIAIGDTHARGGAVPGEDDVAHGIDLGQIRQRAVVGAERAEILELELLHGVGDPALAEAFPGQEIDAARAQQRPERQLHRPGVRARHDADAIIRGQPQDGAGAVNHLFQFGFAGLRAVRAAEAGIPERLQRPSRTLGART